MIEKLKSQLLKQKLQFIEIDSSGIVLNSEDNLFEINKGISIYNVDPFFEAIRHYITDLDRDQFQLSCINLNINGKEGIFDIIIKKGETIAIIIVDFTSHYKISNTISQQRNESMIQAQLLEERDNFKNTFLANTSHELRTPLSTIMGFTTVLKIHRCYSRSNA